MNKLLRHLRGRLSAEDLAAIERLFSPPRDEDYDAVFAAVRTKLPHLIDQVERNRRRLEERYEDLAELPLDRLQLVIDNSPPSLLRALAESLIKQSFAERLSNPQRSLRLAQTARTAVVELRERGFLATQPQADLEAEAMMYLGNARRINSDLVGAERAFADAEALLAQGTGDRRLRADLLGLRASLRLRQARPAEAAELLDRQISLCRLLGDESKLGESLVNRGVVAAFGEPLDTACRLLGEGATIAGDHALLTCLQALAERLARDGDGDASWMVVRNAELAARLLGTSDHDISLQWIRGISYRARGDHPMARRELSTARSALVSAGSAFRAALVSLDLAAVCAAMGDLERVKQLAIEASVVFEAESLHERALAAFMVFHNAVEAESLTEELAVRVANFVVRSQVDGSLRFDEGP